MSSQSLEKARAYEAQAEGRIPPQQRPLLHACPRTGWMNDPNGLSWYQGAYHLFYQYHPYDTSWGPMHWGHLVSEDLLRWRFLPAAMAPDQPYDREGCFSGSALESPDGRHLLLYTGCTRDPATGEPRQVQCLAVGDGVNYEKIPQNPVMTDALLPEGASKVDFRDPKLWWDAAESRYYCVAGSRPADGSGSVLLFASPDAVHWEFVSVLDQCRNEYGKMWECPDFFQLDGRAVLLVSPQDMRARGLEFHNGNGTLCLIGDYDPAAHAFTRRSTQAIDYGLDFYAPQTLLTPDGRRVMIGWMQSWETSRIQPENTNWFGMMTLPRQLRVEDGRLCQLPVEEISRYYRDEVRHAGLVSNRQLSLPGLEGRLADITLTVTPGSEELYRSFTLHLAHSSEYDTRLRYWPASGILEFDRTDSGFPHDIPMVRRVDTGCPGGRLELRVVLDRYSVEVFVNGGRQAITSVIHTPQQAADILLEAEGTVEIDLEKHALGL